jgi:hypothetical protein
MPATRPLKLLLRCAATAAVAFSAASARPADDDGPEQPKQHHIGKITFTPRILLKSAGVETNVFQTLQDPVRDDIAVISPRVDGFAPLSDHTRVSGMGFLEQYYYRQNAQERATNFYGEGEVVGDYGPWVLKGGGGGGQFTERLSVEVGDLLTHQEERAHAGATLKVSRRISATVQASGETYTYSPGVFRYGGNIKDALDRRTLLGAAQLRYTLTSLTTAVVGAEVQNDNFPSQPPVFPRDHQSYRYVGGLELADRAMVSGRVLAGVREFPGTLAEGIVPYTGPVVSADLTAPVLHVLRLHGVGERDVQYGANIVVFGPSPYRNTFILTRYLGDGLVDLPWNLTAFAGGGFEQADYLLPYPVPETSVFAKRLDHRWSSQAGLYRRFGNTLKIGGHIGWVRRVSTVTLYSYEDVTYALTAEVIP